MLPQPPDQASGRGAGPQGSPPPREAGESTRWLPPRVCTEGLHVHAFPRRWTAFTLVPPAHALQPNSGLQGSCFPCGVPAEIPSQMAGLGGECRNRECTGVMKDTDHRPPSLSAQGTQCSAANDSQATALALAGRPVTSALQERV